LKESDLENFDSLLRLMAGCDSHEVFRMLAILAGVDRMATTAPGRKLESRVAAFRWFVAHPDRITLGDEDTARRVARDVRKLSPEVQEIIEGLTWVDSSESTKTDQQDNRSERPNLFDKISDASESRGRAASNRKSRQSGQPKKTPR
jgi:hypothetical protein